MPLLYVRSVLVLVGLYRWVVMGTLTLLLLTGTHLYFDGKCHIMQGVSYDLFVVEQTVLQLFLSLFL